MFRLKPAASFEELTDNPVWAEELRRVYGDVERVDLMIGMYAEPKVVVLAEEEGISSEAGKPFEARAIACFAVLTASGARAQETINHASVSGRVVDPAGRCRVRRARLREQTDTNVTADDETDEGGRFRFAYLKVGPYEVSVHADGFADSARHLRLTLGSASILPFSLSLATLDTRVTVSGDASVLDTARSQIAGTVPQAEIESMPMNGRNFLDLALLIPGVSPTNTGSTQLFAETSAVPGQGLSINSQRNLSNSFIVDGLSANDDAAGLSGIPYGVDAIDQFQVVTSGGQAELGRALGGYVNVVTRSGTNQVHGTATASARRPPQCGQRAVRHDAADGPAAVRRQPRRPDSQEPHVLLHELRAAPARSVG